MTSATSEWNLIGGDVDWQFIIEAAITRDEPQNASACEPV